MVVLETFGKNGQCSICKLSEIDAVNYGDIHSNKELTVHLFCLYFSTNLLQNGKENAGIVGFQLHDIRRLISQCAKEICCYCKKGSATTGCHHPDCRSTFHQVCGFKANARFEYVGEFRSFCDKHNRIENENLPYPEIVGCVLCYEGLPSFNPVTTIPSCCGLWFHQQCLRKYALNAGYSFMCPGCRDKKYADFARRHGIYVPEYESLWEKTNDYADIERFYTNCHATDCLCPKGRKFSNHKWNLQLCSCCGSYGYHKLCRPVAERNDNIICKNCETVVDQWKSNDPHNTNSLLADLYSQQEEDAKREQEEDAKKEEEEAKKRDERAKQKAEDEKIIDLADDNILDERIASDAMEVDEEIVVENGVNNERKTVDRRSTNFEELFVVPETRSTERTEEILALKRAREKAERPLRDEMRNFLIRLWFRDRERFHQEPVETEEAVE